MTNDEPDILEDFVLTYRDKENTLDANNDYFFFYAFNAFRDIRRTISHVHSQLDSLNIPTTCLSITVHPLYNGFIVKLDYTGLKLLLAKAHLEEEKTD